MSRYDLKNRVEKLEEQPAGRDKPLENMTDAELCRIIGIEDPTDAELKAIVEAR